MPVRILGLISTAVGAVVTLIWLAVILNAIGTVSPGSSSGF